MKEASITWEDYLSFIAELVSSEKINIKVQQNFLDLWDKIITKYPDIRHPAVFFWEDDKSLFISWKQRDIPHFFELEFFADGKFDWFYSNQYKNINDRIMDGSNDPDIVLPDHAMDYLSPFNKKII